MTTNRTSFLRKAVRAFLILFVLIVMVSTCVHFTRVNDVRVQIIKQNEATQYYRQQNEEKDSTLNWMRRGLNMERDKVLSKQKKIDSLEGSLANEIRRSKALEYENRSLRDSLTGKFRYRPGKFEPVE